METVQPLFNPPVSGEGVYANEALYANLSGDPLYANVTEVCNLL